VKYLFLALSALALATATAHGGTVYFLVAEPPGLVTHGDSYVLPLTRPEDIAHARQLIAKGPKAGAPIVVAAIAAGADGVNRDYLDPDAPEWSWHVTDFLGFADSAAEILDGWPEYVEEDVKGWISNTDGMIGFWDYTVVAELGE
jgi:hypothetical protein